MASPPFISISVKTARDPLLTSPTEVIFVTSFVAPTYKSLVCCGLPCAVTVDPNTMTLPLALTAGGKKLMTGPRKIGSCCPNAASEMSDRSAAMKGFMHSSGRGNLIIPPKECAEGIRRTPALWRSTEVKTNTREFAIPLACISTHGVPRIPCVPFRALQP